MDKDLNDSEVEASQDSDGGQSLVGILKKNVSEIISNTPISKWFRKQNNAAPASSTRRRQDDSEDEEDMEEFQPPTKRSKLPPTKETLSLNVSEALSPISSANNVKKSLYKNFPEPIAGPSGYQTRKMLNSTSFGFESRLRSSKTREDEDNTFKNPKTVAGPSEVVNKDSHSDSEESTSGYSSGRMGSKEIVSQESSKQSSPLENSPQKSRSLFQGSSSGRLFISDRSLSPNRNSSLSSRMPSFNPSTFGSSSFVDRTLSTKRILNSPFYNGHTIYGGASAYGRNTKRVPQDIQKVLRQSVKIKPANRGLEKGDLQLGKTARRILDTLEQYSSPISDVKKIPVASKKYKSEGSLAKYIGANPYTLRESRSASNRELQVPSVTDLLKMKMDQQKTRLQDSTEAVRQIAIKSNNEGYQIPVQRENEKHTTKIKTKITSIRHHKLTVEETLPEVQLNPVSLPIKELPKFDIIVPPPVEKPLVAPIVSEPVSIPICNKIFEPKVVEVKLPVSKDKVISSDDSEFKFSAPLILAEFLKPLKALNNFKFSEPLVKKRRSIHPELDDQENKVVDSNKSKKNNGENIYSGFKKPVDSVMEKFKPKENTWECLVCLIRNQPDKVRCAACESPRPKSKLPAEPIQSFGPPISVKPPENTWECPTCMIRNKEDLQKCAACEEKKPDKSSGNGILKVPTTTPTNTQGTEGVQSQKAKPFDTLSSVSSSEPPVTTASLNFGTKFTYPSNSWECPTCMIRNKEELTKCAACESPKPSPKGELSQPAPATFGTDFKKKADEWECQVCMVRNKASAEKCQCCESSNPNAKPSSSAAASPKVSNFNFGIDKNTASSFTFGIPPGSQSVPKTNAAFVFGDKRQEPVAKSAESQSFSFGVPPKDSKEPPKPTEKAEEPPPKAAPPAYTFDAVSKASEATPAKPTPTFSFGAEPKATEATPAKPTPSFSLGSTSKSEGTSATPSFSFGTVKKVEEPVAPSFSIGAAKSDSPASPAFTFSSTNKTDNKDKEGGDVKVNPLLKPSEKLPEKAAVAPVGFSFGLPKVSTAAPVSSTTKTVPNEISSTDDASPTKRSRPAPSESTPQAKVPTFSFKAPATQGESLFSKPALESKPSAPSAGGFNFSFGPATTTSSSATVPPSFGSTVVSQADSSKHVAAPMFKFASSTEPPKQPNGFNFGSSASTFGSKPAEAKPFAFGGSAPTTQAPASSFAATPPKTGLFSFGATTAENKPSTFPFNTPKTQPSFAFGQSSAPTFSFGTNQKTESTFGAGSTTFGSATTNSKPDSVFGAPNNPLNGAFNFGAPASTNQKAGFSFGASNATGESGTAQQSGFSFGPSAPNATAPGAPGGFNFSGSAPSFDANAKPTFNFTGGAGITAFSAPPPQDGTMPQRKIKKAIRRTVR